MFMIHEWLIFNVSLIRNNLFYYSLKQYAAAGLLHHTQDKLHKGGKRLCSTCIVVLFEKFSLSHYFNHCLVTEWKTYQKQVGRLCFSVKMTAGMNHFQRDDRNLIYIFKIYLWALHSKNFLQIFLSLKWVKSCVEFIIVLLYINAIQQAVCKIQCSQLYQSCSRSGLQKFFESSSLCRANQKSIADWSQFLYFGPKWIARSWPRWLILWLQTWEEPAALQSNAIHEGSKNVPKSFMW